MKFLRSTWFLAALAIMLSFGVQAFVLLRHTIPAPTDAASSAHDTTKPPARIAWDFQLPDIKALRAEMHSRLAEIAKREEDLRDYELRLKAERAEIEKIKREIQTVRDDLSTKLLEIETTEQKNLKTLATTYSNMTPEAAIVIFKEMNDDMVVKILAFMKTEPVGRIFEAMANTRDGDGTLAEKAALLSNKLRLLHQLKPGETT